ncbi:MAG: tetratricopeptide repeat protein [Treponema sp.]|nr:tetratricopeptide repeat protein [Treponema sp.]
MFFGKRALAAFCFLCLCASGLSGQSSFAQGEELFLRNKPQEALVYLESAIAENPDQVRAYLYLGVAYQQLDRLDEAVVIYRRALPLAGPDTALIAYNLGNVYYAQGKLTQAEECYTQALEANPGYAAAYLNRGNARLTRQALQDAVYDYEAYLNLEPGSAKRGRIEQLISAIRSDFASAERERIQAEAQASAEADRKRRILEEAAASLQSAAEDTKGLSSGSEGALGYEGEFELE